MSQRLVFCAAAQKEFDDAAAWYESHRAGLGDDFVAAIQQTLDRISDHLEISSECAAHNLLGIRARE